MRYSLFLVSQYSVLLVVLLIFLLGQILVLGLLTHFMVKTSLSRFRDQPSPDVPEEQLSRDSANYLNEDNPGSLWFHQHVDDFEHWYITSHDGLKLHAWYLPCPDARKTALIVHGYGDRLGAISLYAKYFQSRRWNALMIDQRAHGYSEGRYFSLSVNESHDLLCWTDELKARQSELEDIIWVGWSMGAATVLQVSDLQIDKLRGIIADSGFTSIKDISIAAYESRLLKTFFRLFLPLISLAVRPKIGVSLNQGSALEHVKNKRYPLLLFHGDQDARVPVEMGKALYLAAKEPKKLVIAEGSAHVRGISEQYELYEKSMDEFINSIM